MKGDLQETQNILYVQCFMLFFKKHLVKSKREYILMVDFLDKSLENPTLIFLGIIGVSLEYLFQNNQVIQKNFLILCAIHTN